MVILKSVWRGRYRIFIVSFVFYHLIIIGFHGDENWHQLISYFWYTNLSSSPSNSSSFIEIHRDLRNMPFSIVVFLVFIKFQGVVFNLLLGFPAWWFLTIKLPFLSSFMERARPGFRKSRQNVEWNRIPASGRLLLLWKKC